MSAIKVIKRTVELGGNTASSSFPDPIPPYFFNDETDAHMFMIFARQNGQPFPFTTESISACFLNDIGTTVSITGSIVNGAACVTLSDACYQVSGSFTLTISVSGAVVYECRGTIKVRSSGTAYDPTGEISVAGLSSEIAEMRTATAEANAAGHSLLYALEDMIGGTVGPVLPGKAVYISNGALADPVNSATFGYCQLSCEQGDQFRLTGTGGNNARLWIIADVSGNVLSNAAAYEIQEDYVLTVSQANAAKIVFNVQLSNPYSIIKGDLLIDTVDAAVAEIEDDYNVFADALGVADLEIFAGDNVTPLANPPQGWKLVSETGLCVSDSNYQLVKYEVSPGRTYYVKTDGRFQFQNVASVPSTGTSNRIGNTITGGGFVVVAPAGGYYLIISTLVDGGVSIVKQVNSRIYDLEKLPILMQGIGISGNVIDLSSIETRDSFISSSGAVSQSASYAYTAGITVKEGQTIALYACGYLDRVAMISKFDGTTYTPVVLSTDSSVKLYTYTSDEDCTLVLSYGYHYSHIAMLSSENTVAIGRYLYSDVQFTNVVWGKYISAGGVVSGGANDYRYTQPFLLPAGMEIEFKGAGYQQNVAMIAKYNGDGMDYTPLVISTDSTLRTYKYHADKDIYIALSYNNTQEHKASYHLVPYPNESIDYSVLFPKVSVIGDSLSSGCLYINGSYTDFYGDSWLSYIARRCGLKRNHYSKGGLTCKTWIEQYLAKLQSDEASNAYFIALGTNDSWSLPYEMGTASDAAGTNTFAGYYKQIIEAVRAKAPNAVIFCLSLYKANQTYNPLIQAISRQYANTYYMDIPGNSDINTDTGGVWSAGSHFTTVGYRYIANVIYDQMNTIVSANLTAFKFFGQYNSVGGQFEFGDE